MGVFVMLFRKMVNNRWLMACLLIGILLCTSLSASLPIYKQAMLERMLVQQLDRFYTESGTYPGNIQGTALLTDKNNQEERVSRAEKRWEDGVLNDMGLYPLDYIVDMKSYTFSITPVDPTKADARFQRFGHFVMRTDLLQHVELISGRLPSSDVVDGVFEVLVTDRTLGDFEIVLGVEFEVNDSIAQAPMRLQPVGVIREDDLSSLYWNDKRLLSFGSAFFIDESLFRKQFLQDGVIPVETLKWNVNVDYRQLDIPAAQRLQEYVEDLNQSYKSTFGSINKVILPAIEHFDVFGDYERRLQSLLLALYVPQLLIIAFYLHMVSALLLERQRSEISVLRSRGASRKQIITLYALESGVLGLLAFLMGPWIGAWFTRIVGSSNSFMSFVQRDSLNVQVNGESFLYAGAAILLALAIRMIPILWASRFSIVDQKRQQARQQRSTVWHRFGFDFILLGMSLYGYYTFRQRMDDLTKLGLDSIDFQIDPLLFAVPSFFIFGLGLLLLRIYPYLIRLIYRLGRSWWSPSLYATLLLVGRRSHQYMPLMLLLVITLGTGIYSVSAAHTLNQNMEEQIWYRNGAELIVQQKWHDNAPPAIAGFASTTNEPIQYKEPPFEAFNKLPGVEEAAKVLVKDDVLAYTSRHHDEVKVMAIDTDDFGATSWMKDGLISSDFHYFDYLNLIAPNPHALLVSRTLSETYRVSPGDSLDLNINGKQVSGVIYGVIDYFPTFNPNVAYNSRNSSNSNFTSTSNQTSSPMLVVAHLEMVQNEGGVEPYQVWMKLSEGASVQELFDALPQYDIRLTSYTDTRGEIVESRNDPFRLAINGVMSLSFLLSLMISFVGFMLYWMLSLLGRMLQFGVFRAMGISFRSLLSMFGVEQLLSTCAGLVIGITSGMVAGVLFVPMFQLAFNPSAIVPPFAVQLRILDVMGLSLVTLFMMGLALVILSLQLKRMKIHQVLKLGED